MKLILTLWLSLFSHAEGTPETVKVTDSPEQALFERIREAHLRALQKGIVITHQKRS